MATPFLPAVLVVVLVWTGVAASVYLGVDIWLGIGCAVATSILLLKIIPRPQR